MTRLILIFACSIGCSSAANRRLNPLASMDQAAVLSLDSFSILGDKLSLLEDRLTRRNGLILAPEIEYLITQLTAALGKDRHLY